MILDVLKKYKAKGHTSFQDPQVVSEDELTYHMLSLHLRPKTRFDLAEIARHDIEVAYIRGFEIEEYKEALYECLESTKEQLIEAARIDQKELWSPSTARLGFVVELAYMEQLGLADVEWPDVLPLVSGFNPNVVNENFLNTITGEQESYFYTIGYLR